MKTLEEFLRRLQDDPEFEKQAQAFDNGDELISFVHRQGYDFTLEQLINKFKPGQGRNPAGKPAPAAKFGQAFSPRLPDDPKLSQKPEFFPIEEKRPTLAAPGRDDFTPPGPAAGSLQELARGTGGRHRGLSPLKLRGILVQEPFAGDAPL